MTSNGKQLGRVKKGHLKVRNEEFLLGGCDAVTAPAYFPSSSLSEILRCCNTKQGWLQQACLLNNGAVGVVFSCLLCRIP